MSVNAMLRMEDRIRKLCQEIVETKNDVWLVERLVELRAVLHQHVESLRLRLRDYPLTGERRNPPDTDDTPSPENPLTNLDTADAGPPTIQAKADSE
jgi:hypothetical protein